jgi:hypothetical protein
MENNYPTLGVSQGSPDDSPLVVQRKNELLMYGQSFYRKSWDWRSQSFHSKWDKYDRNYESIYDPQKAAGKEPWQSTMFVDVTVQNTEIIVSQIYKTMMAPKPPIQTEAGPDGDDLQARLIQDIVDYELRKASFDVNFYDALKEAVKYGSGFIKLYWERVVDTRQRRVPIMQSPMDVLNAAPPQALTGQTPLPNPQIQGFQMQPQEVLLRNQLCARYVHIRDIFPEPNTTRWDKVLHRDKLDYGTICRAIQKGQFFDVRGQLENVTEGEKFEQDLLTIKQELGYFDANRMLSKFEKKHTVWELILPIPRKWIQFDLPEDTPEQKDYCEELVPGRVGIASGVALLYSEENKMFDGEVNVLKLDYIRTGQTYGKGIPELVQDDQEELNEHANSGIDYLSYKMNQGVVVLENALVNAEQDLKVAPGWMVRLKSQVVDSVDKGFKTIEFPDLGPGYFQHRFELQNQVQEKTGASKVTLGTGGQVRDTNQTLGGMELLRQMFNERVAAYGMVIESAFLMKVAEKVYSLIYQELSPEDLKPILGDHPVHIGDLPPPPGAPPGTPPMPHMIPRFLAFAFPPPELVNNSYRFKPMGIFSLENKVVKDAQIKDLIKLGMAADPMGMRFNAIDAIKYDAVQVNGISEAEKWFPEVPMIPISMIPPPLLPLILNPQQPGEGVPSPQTNKKDSPGMKGGDNGTGASFAPPNPVRRQPVV